MDPEIIAGTPRGGGQDRTARALASVIDGRVTISNVSGRGGGNGWDLLARRIGAENLVAVSSPTLVTNAIVGEAIIDHRDLTPLAMLYTEYSAIVVSSGSRWEDPKLMFGAIAEGTLTVSFATALGNMNHLALAEIAAHLGGQVRSLPIRVFESAPQALADVVAGNGDIAIVTAVSAVEGLSEGTLSPVAVTAPVRLGDPFSQTPTCLEMSVPCVRGTWRGVVGPPGLDPDRVARWEQTFSVAVATERWNRLLEENLWVDSYLGSDDTWSFLEAEREVLGELLGQLGLVIAVDNG
jgi:tripartite-type tricarboxylate transporter receptor subunit TctC